MPPYILSYIPLTYRRLAVVILRLHSINDVMLTGAGPIRGLASGGGRPRPIGVLVEI